MFAFLRSLFHRPEPHPVLAENRRLFAEFDQSRPLTDYSFVVLDTELTGLGRRDEIISIGAVKMSNMQIEMGSTFHTLVRPLNLSHNQATFIHQITPEQLRSAPSMREVLPEFVAFCGDALLVGHFIDLDMRFLSKAAERELGGTLSNPGIDTMRLARRYNESGLRDFYGQNDQSAACNLDSLVEEFNLPRFKAHDALEDALQTSYLFLYLVKKFRQDGIATLKDLYRAGRGG
jgi:DNA polymerase-3 subunit epsilon